MMDHPERVALEHLRFRGFSSVVYEPDGKKPPDFLVDGRIAVEVRRLAQTNGTTGADLDESSIPLANGLRGLFASYGASEVTRFIDARFSRPLPKWPQVRRGARRFLDAVQTGQLPEGASQTIAPNVALQYVCSARVGGAAFELNDLDDSDWGGWLLGEYGRNLAFCVAEKLTKIRPFRYKYPEWWLILVTQPVYGLTKRNISLFRKASHVAHDLERLIVVDGGDPTCYFEIS